MALHLTSCARVSDIPRSVFAGLAAKIDRGDVVLVSADIATFTRGHHPLRWYECHPQEKLAVIEALRERAK
jgi:hypothetical protein